MLFVILTEKKIVGTFQKNKISKIISKKQIKKSLKRRVEKRVEKLIKRKGDKIIC